MKESRKLWKADYFKRLKQLFGEYDKCFIVCVDNVGSKQMQQIRASMRGSCVILMGKNTMMRKALQMGIDSGSLPQVEPLMEHIRGNVGMVLTRDDLNDVRTKILANQVEAPARAGALAPINVTIPAQATTLGPEKTSFFQALSIPTKITRGCIEILHDVPIIHAGDRVGASEATLLNMLGISPFSYGLVIRQVYDSGAVFEPAVLDITPAEVMSRFAAATRKVAALSMAIGRPTAAAAPHMLINGFKRVLAVAVETDYTFPLAERTKEYLADPAKFAAAAAAPAATEAAAAPDAGKGGKEKEKAPPSDDSGDESDGDMGMGLFD